MGKISKAGRSFYAIALVAYGFQQFIYADFRTVFVPAWQSWLPGLAIWACIFGTGLIAAGSSIILEKKARETSLIAGGIFLLLFCLVHVPYEIISDPNSIHFGVWTNSLKELALSGGAFVIAGTFRENNTNVQKKAALVGRAEKFISFGKIFFSITIVSFGIEHFMYTDFVTALVPEWFPDPIFWTYFSGVSLIGSGVAIILNIRTREVAILLGIMLFLWFILLHLPRAIATPFSDRGNEVASAFDALAFSGIAFVIACRGGYSEKEELT